MSVFREKNVEGFVTKGLERAIDWLMNLTRYYLAHQTSQRTVPSYSVFIGFVKNIHQAKERVRYIVTEITLANA